MNFISKKVQEYEGGTFRLVKENDDGTGLFIYKGESVILKRCKRGYWKDPATGQCVPKDQLRGTDQPSAPKQEQSAPKESKPAEDKPKQEKPKEKKPKNKIPPVPKGKDGKASKEEYAGWVDENILNHKIIQGKYERYDMAEDLYSALQDGDNRDAVRRINMLLDEGPVSRSSSLSNSLEELKEDLYQNMTIYSEDDPDNSVLPPNFVKDAKLGAKVLNHLLDKYEYEFDRSTLKEVKKLADMLGNLNEIKTEEDVDAIMEQVGTTFGKKEMSNLYYGQKNENMREAFFAIMDIKNYGGLDAGKAVRDYNDFKKKSNRK